MGFSSLAFHSQSHAGSSPRVDFVPCYEQFGFARVEKVDPPPVGKSFRPILDCWSMEFTQYLQSLGANEAAPSNGQLEGHASSCPKLQPRRGPTSNSPRDESVRRRKRDCSIHPPN